MSTWSLFDGHWWEVAVYQNHHDCPHLEQRVFSESALAAAVSLLGIIIIADGPADWLGQIVVSLFKRIKKALYWFSNIRYFQSF